MRSKSRCLKSGGLLLAVVLSLLTACDAITPPKPIPSPTPSWQEFKPEGAGFAVLMPAAAQSEEETLDTLFGQLELIKYWSKFDTMLFGIGYSSLPDDFITAHPAEQILEAFQEGGLRYFSGHLLSSKAIKLGDYPGLEATFEVPDNRRTPGGGIMRVRLYLIGNVVYEIDHVGSKRQSISPDIKKFMDSFQLTGETPVMTPAPIEAGEWQEFQSPEGNFSVLMPRAPLKEFMPLGGDFGPIELNVFTTKFGNMEYVAGYVDLPADKLKQYKTATLLRNMAYNVANIPNRRILSSKALKLNGQPGHEVIAEGTSSTGLTERVVLRIRLYLVEDRLYEVLLAVPKSQSQSPEVRKFFDSFALLTNP